MVLTSRLSGGTFFVLGLLGFLLGGTSAGTISAQLFSGGVLMVTGVLLIVAAELVEISRKMQK